MVQRNQVRKVGGQEQDPAPVNTFLRVTSCARTRWKWPPAPANKIFRPDALGVAAGPGEHIFARHFLRPDALRDEGERTYEPSAAKNGHVAPAVGGQWHEGIPKEPGTMGPHEPVLLPLPSLCAGEHYYPYMTIHMLPLWVPSWPGPLPTIGPTTLI